MVKQTTTEKHLVPDEIVMSKIRIIREQKVMQLPNPETSPIRRIGFRQKTDK